MTNRQREILRYIESFIKENGFPPTNKEIGDGVGLLSKGTVHRHLGNLEQKGYIRRNHSKPRARALELLLPEERQLIVSDISEKDRDKLFIELVKRGYRVAVK